MIRAFKTMSQLPFEWRIQRFDLIDNQGRLIAPVLDLLLDPETSAVRWVMIEVGGLMGIRGKILLLPPALILRAGGGTVQAITSQPIILDAPAPEHPDEPTREEEAAICDYFEEKPYWEDRGLYKKKEGAEEAKPSAKPDAGPISDLALENDDQGNS